MSDVKIVSSDSAGTLFSVPPTTVKVVALPSDTPLLIEIGLITETVGQLEDRIASILQVPTGIELLDLVGDKRTLCIAAGIRDGDVLRCVHKPPYVGPLMVWEFDEDEEGSVTQHHVPAHIHRAIQKGSLLIASYGHDDKIGVWCLHTGCLLDQDSLIELEDLKDIEPDLKTKKYLSKESSSEELVTWHSNSRVIVKKVVDGDGTSIFYELDEDEEIQRATEGVRGVCCPKIMLLEDKNRILVNSRIVGFHPYAQTFGPGSSRAQHHRRSPLLHSSNFGCGEYVNN